MRLHTAAPHTMFLHFDSCFEISVLWFSKPWVASEDSTLSGFTSSRSSDVRMEISYNLRESSHMKATDVDGWSDTLQRAGPCLHRVCPHSHMQWLKVTWCNPRLCRTNELAEDHDATHVEKIPCLVSAVQSHNHTSVPQLSWWRCHLEVDLWPFGMKMSSIVWNFENIGLRPQLSPHGL